MERKPIELEPRFNRDLFREDQEALNALFSGDLLAEEGDRAEFEHSVLMVEHVFSHVPAALPEADFTRRWEKRLRRRRRRERIQWFLAISSSLAIATIAVSAVLWSQVITEARQYIMVGISMFFTSPELISLVEGFRDGLILFGRNVYPEILIVPIGLAIWGMVWGSSLFWLMTVKPQVLHYGLQA